MVKYKELYLIKLALKRKENKQMKKSMKRVLELAFILGLILISNTIAWADPEEPSWTGIANMPTPRYYLQTEVIDGKIYAIGGNNKSFLSSTEVYDPATNS